LDNAGISKLHLMMKPQESSSAQLSKLKCDSPDHKGLELQDCKFMRDATVEERQCQPDRSLEVRRPLGATSAPLRQAHQGCAEQADPRSSWSLSHLFTPRRLSCGSEMPDTRMLLRHRISPWYWLYCSRHYRPVSVIPFCMSFE